MADLLAGIQGLASGFRRYRDMGDGTLAEVVSAAQSPYPVNAAPLIASSGNKANTSAAATLTPGATQTAYLTGFEVTGSGAVAGLPVTVTVAGILGGTQSFTYTFAAGVLVPNQPLIVPFPVPLPASAINTPIVVTCPASGAGGTNNTVVAHGYAL